MTTLSLENVSVARGPRNVVHDVTISVPPGEVTTLLGPNGAGKSSLALACAGLARVTTGWVYLESNDVANHRPEKIRAAGMSVVPEGRRLLPNLTVEENLNVSTFSLGKQAAADGLDY
ncbi:MAG TPA: ATP-binding cassette domain-containing protein, partial [Ilumatobacteraceae bacterium]|nr:ATP-binding cassette domain-containing protein [Ilumatobacteraceae bacterium]